MLIGPNNTGITSHLLLISIFGQCKKYSGSFKLTEHEALKKQCMKQYIAGWLNGQDNRFGKGLSKLKSI